MPRRKKDNACKPYSVSLPPDVYTAVAAKAAKEGKSTSQAFHALALKYLTGDAEFEEKEAQRALNEAQANWAVIQDRKNEARLKMLQTAESAVKRYYSGVSPTSMPQKKTLIIQLNAIDSMTGLGAATVFPYFYRTLTAIGSEAARSVVKEYLDEMSIELNLPKE